MAPTTSPSPIEERAGRPDAGAAGARLSELFIRHGPTVLGLCRLLLRQREEAEDAAQQTFLSAYRSLLNGVEPRHPAAWLATIARNECWGRIRQRMRTETPDVGTEPPSSVSDPVAAAAAKADLAALWDAIRSLPRKQRQALLLREFSGLSYDELALALAVSEPAVESLLFRARRELRMRLRLAYGALGSVAPLAAIRELLGRLGGETVASPVAGAAAKAAAAPLVAKLAAGAAAVAVVGGTVAAIETPSTSRPRPPAKASVAAPRTPAPVSRSPRQIHRPVLSGAVLSAAAAPPASPQRTRSAPASAPSSTSAVSSVPPPSPPSPAVASAAPPPRPAETVSRIPVPPTPPEPTRVVEPPPALPPALPALPPAGGAEEPSVADDGAAGADDQNSVEHLEAGGIDPSPETTDGGSESGDQAESSGSSGAADGSTADGQGDGTSPGDAGGTDGGTQDAGTPADGGQSDSAQDGGSAEGATTSGGDGGGSGPTATGDPGSGQSASEGDGGKTAEPDQAGATS